MNRNFGLYMAFIKGETITVITIIASVITMKEYGSKNCNKKTNWT